MLVVLEAVGLPFEDLDLVVGACLTLGYKPRNRETGKLTRGWLVPGKSDLVPIGFYSAIRT